MKTLPELSAASTFRRKGEKSRNISPSALGESYERYESRV